MLSFAVALGLGYTVRGSRFALDFEELSGTLSGSGVDIDEAFLQRKHVTVLDPEMQAVLDLHNKMRCMHDVPLMTWDSEIAEKAQEWADIGKWEHSSYHFRTYLGNQYHGENLAWGSPTRTGINATQAWYDEIRFTTNGLTSTAFGPNGEALGHYTQIVWTNSTRLGCGKGRAVINGSDGDYWVCHYGPGGNINGQFDNQVTSPSRNESQCVNATHAPTSQPPPSSPPPSSCKDGRASDSPVINHGAECSSLKWACEIHDVVREKCPRTCENCSGPSPAPPPTSGPSPAPPPTCQDKCAQCNPVINHGAECSSLKWACVIHDVVREKCPRTCGTCSGPSPPAPPPTCQDGCAQCEPVIKAHGSTTPLACSSLERECAHFAWVRSKCERTCGTC